MRAAAAELISAGYSIIVLSHSWGGLVASEAITENFYAKGGSPGVVRLIYLSAWLIPPGTSLPQLFQKYGFQSGIKWDIDADQMAWVVNAKEAFYHDVDDEGMAEELEGELVTHNFRELSSEGAPVITKAPWKDVETSVVVCTRDRGIYLDLQEKMVRDARDNGGKGFKVFTLESSHGPFWSMPGKVVEIIEEVWKSFLKDEATN